MGSFVEYVVFFWAVFCTEQLEMICRMDFNFFIETLIFDPQWGFYMGYGLCMMADVENGLFSRICSFFGGAFCTEQLEMICRMDFDMVFGILIFNPKWGFCMGYGRCMITDIQNGLTSGIFNVFGSGVSHRTTRNDL